MKSPTLPRRLLPLLIGLALAAGPALAADKTPAPTAPTAQQKAAREEIDRLTQRIEELSKQLGDDGEVRVIVRRVGGPDGPDRGMRWHDRDDEDGDMGPGEHRIKRIELAGPGADRPGLGVVLGPNPAASGVRIAAVTPDSPAMKAGLRSGDIVMSIDGKKISGSGVRAVDQTRDLLGDLKQGQVVTIVYAREGKTGTAKVSADRIHRAMAFYGGDDGPVHLRMREDGAMRLPPGVELDIERLGPMKHCRDEKDCGMPALAEAFRWQGLNLASVDADLGRYFGTDHGVLVLSSSDDLKGLRAGDVIQKVGGDAAKSPRDVMRALRDRKDGEQVRFELLRDRKTSSVQVTVPKARPLPFMAPPPPPAPPAPPAPPTPGVKGVAPAPPAPPVPPAAPPPPAPPLAMADGEMHSVRIVRVDRGDGAPVVERIEVDGQHSY